MSLDIIEKATSLADGPVNSLKADLKKIKLAKSKVDVLFNDLDGKLQTMGALQPENLPIIPTEGQITTAVDNAKGTALGDIGNIENDLGGLTGSCLDGAKGALGDMLGDPTEFLKVSMSSISSVVPIDVLQISDVMKAIETAIKSLGLDALIAAAYEKLGCLAGNPIATDILSELDSTVAALGLSGDGTFDPATFTALMDSKVDAIAGFPTEFKDNLKGAKDTIGNAQTELATSLENTGQAIAAKKPTLPKLSVPKSFF